MPSWNPHSSLKRGVSSAWRRWTSNLTASLVASAATSAADADFMFALAVAHAARKDKTEMAKAIEAITVEAATVAVTVDTTIDDEAKGA